MYLLVYQSIQQNAFPRKTQTRIDMYQACTYGDSSISVTMKIRTFKTSDDEAPYLDIQMVVEPPRST